MNNNAKTKIEHLKQHIAAGEISQALDIIGSPVTKEDYKPEYDFWEDNQANHQFAKDMVYAILCGSEPNKELVNVSLSRFAETRKKRGGDHGYWVHSLSHLTDELWQLGLKDWIKQLNEIAFVGANEFSDNNCCNRLVGDFLNKATWDANPEEYGLTGENLRWTLVPARYSGDTTKPEDGLKMLERVKRYPFASEEEWVAAQRV